VPLAKDGLLVGGGGGSSAILPQADRARRARVGARKQGTVPP
jgi:hypothetical protein